MEKRLFNFYLDDSTKDAAILKLEKYMGKKEKGALSSLIRVMLKNFVMTTDSDEIAALIEKVDEEYYYSQLKNKRSTM